MAVTTKKVFPATTNTSTTTFGPIGIELNNQDDLDVYIAESGETRVLQLKQGTTSTVDSNHPQVNDTTGLYFPPVSVGKALKNYLLSADNNNIIFNSALPSGAIVTAERRTRDGSGDYTAFSAGSTMRSTDLNNALDEVRFTAQEGRNKAFELEGQLDHDDITVGPGKGLTFEGSTIDGNETQINVVDPTADRTITFPNVSGTVVTTGDTATITATMLGPNSVDSSELVDGSVDLSHMSANSVDSARIVDASIVGGDIANNTIADANLVNQTITNTKISASASIDHSKLAGAAGGKVLLGNASNVVTATTISGDLTISNSGVATISSGSIVGGDIAGDAIDGSKIADDSINSEHYVADSIDSEHYAPGSVDTDAIATNAVTATELANNAVDTAAILDDAVNNDKIAANAVGQAQIAADAITGGHIGDDQINSEHYVADSIDTEHYAPNSIDNAALGADCISGDNIADNAIASEHYTAGSITSDKLNAATIVTNSEQAGATANDTSFFTTSASDARYFNVSTGDTIKDGDAFPDNDTTIATTAAINDRIIDLVDDVGGFVPIANETSFPNANPDVNNGTGTLVSIKTLASNHTSNGSGVISISNGTVGNSTVTITGAENSTTYSAGYGMIVETTTTLNTYTFHRLVPKATEVTTVAGKATEIGRLGTADAVADMNTLGTAAIVEDMNLLGTAACVADMALLGTTACVADMATIADTSNLIANIGTVAGIQANVTTVAGNNSNVTTVATNISDVNNFADLYQIASSNPSTDGGSNSLAAGDLYFNTSANELKVYNGSSWQGGVTASGNFASITGNTFTGSNIHNDDIKSIYGTSSDGLEIYHSGTASYIVDSGTGDLIIRASDQLKIQDTDNGENMAIFNKDGSVDLYHNNVKKFETTSTGATITGGLNLSGELLNNNHIQIQADDKHLIVGAGDDLRLYHSSGNSFIVNDEGYLLMDAQGASNDLVLRAGNDVLLQPKNGENGIKVIGDAGVELYYDNVKKFETTSAGATVTGTLTADLADNSIDSEHYVDGSIDNAHLADDAVDSDELAAGAVDIAHLSASGTASSSTYLRGDNSWATVTSVGGATGVDFNDSVKARFGTGNDLEIYHDPTHGHSFIKESGSGGLIIGASVFEVYNPAISEKIISATADGKVELYYDNSKKFETASNGCYFDGHVIPGSNGGYDLGLNATRWGDVYIKDSKKIKLGDSNDLEIYHDGSKSIIADVGTGGLFVAGSSISLTNAAITETMLYAASDGAVELYHDNTKTFETAANGARVVASEGNYAYLYIDADEGDDNADKWRWEVGNPGHKLSNKASGSWESSIDCTGDGTVKLYYDGSKKFETTSAGVTLPGDLLLDNATNAGRDVHWQPGSDRLAFLDNTKATFGDGVDLQIYHNGTHSYIWNTEGDLQIRSNSMLLLSSSGETYLQGDVNGSTSLWYDNVKTFETESNGVRVLGPEGGSGILKIYADEGDDNQDLWQVVATTGGELHFQSYTSGSWEDCLHLIGNGAAELYYDNSKKLETASGGIKVYNTGSDVKLHTICSTSGYNQLCFGDTDDDDRGSLLYNHTNDALQITCATEEKLRITPTTMGWYDGGAERMRFGTHGELGVCGTGSIQYGASGQVLTSGGESAGMQWKTPGGKILQVVTTHKSDTWGSSSNNSFHDVTGLTVSITPSSTSNKIFLIISLGVLGTNNNTAGVRVYRGSTVIGSGDGDGSRPTFAFGSHQRGDYHQSGVTYHIVDSPSTTSSVTYKIAAGVHGSGTVYVNRTNGDQNNSNLESGRRSSNITAMEVAG